MSELRERLVERSERFDLPPDALQRLLERGSRIQRRRRITVSVLALTVAVAGTFFVLSAFRSNDRLPANQTSPTPKQLATIPDGIYWTQPLTRAELVATMTKAGFSRREAQRFYFDHLTVSFQRWIRMGLVIQDGFWIQTARADTGEQEAGWSGSYRVIGPHIVQASDSGCTISYRFSLSDRTLRLHLLRESGDSPDCGHGDLIPQTAIFDSAPFVLEPQS